MLLIIVSVSNLSISVSCFKASKIYHLHCLSRLILCFSCVMVSISTNLVAGVNKPGTSYLVFLGCGVLGLSVSSLFFFFIPIISLSVCIIISFYGALISYWAILEYMPEFIKRNMCGKDQCKVSCLLFFCYTRHLD